MRSTADLTQNRDWLGLVARFATLEPWLQGPPTNRVTEPLRGQGFGLAPTTIEDFMADAYSWSPRSYPRMRAHFV